MRGPFHPHLCKAPISLPSLFEGSSPFLPSSYLATATQSPAGRGIALPAPMGSGTCGGNGSWFRREHSGQAPPPRPGVVGSPPPFEWALRGRCGRAGLAGPGSQTAEPGSAPSLLPAARGDLTLAPSSEAPTPKFLDWGGGEEWGQHAFSSQPSLGTFSGLLVVRGGTTGLEKRR